MPQLDETWRPDRSEILLMRHGAVPGYTEGGLDIELIGSLQKIFWDPFVQFVAASIERRLPVFLLVPGPPGHTASSTFLNDVIDATVATADLNYVKVALMGTVRSNIRHPKEAINLDSD